MHASILKVKVAYFVENMGFTNLKIKGLNANIVRNIIL